MANPPSGNVHWMVRLNYRNRSLSFLLLFGVLGLHLAEHDPSVVTWLLLGLQFLIYPHILYWLAARSNNMFRAESRSMLLDAALLGCWVSVMGFPFRIGHLPHARYDAGSTFRLC
ncbi:MAG: MASE2 domain-containing protein [Pseudomonas sp.]